MNLVETNNQIRLYREKSGLSQGQLAEACGWGDKAQSRISNYEKETRTPSLDDMRAIVGALRFAGVECSLDDLFPPQPLPNLKTA